MLYAQVHPTFTHDLYLAAPPAWGDGREPELCAVCYGEFVSRGGFTWDNPPEDAWRLHWIEAGHGHIQVNGGPRIALGPGDVFVMRPDAAYYREETAGWPWRYRWLALRGPRAAEALALAGLPPDRALARPGLVRRLEPVFARMRKAMETQEPPLAALCELAFACLHACAQDDEKGAAKPGAQAGRPGHAPPPPRTALAIAWLRQNYTKGATVEDAAKAAGLSRSGLFRAFREHAGQSPKAYLDHLRVEHAKHLLRHGGYALKEVAARCGFADARHFSRAFARKAGRPPAAWARREQTKR